MMIFRTHVICGGAHKESPVMENLSPLKELRNKQSLIRDRIRAVVRGHANGIYLHGRPGLSKTYLVRTTLENLGTRYAYSNGHVTPLGLFELIEESPNSVIVLDDVSSIFTQPMALQILLATLGTPHDGSKTRTVRYKRASGDRVVHFSGSIIAISNLQLAGHDNHVLDALQDRVHVLSYEPTDEEIEASIHEIAATSPRGVESRDAVQVASFLLDACREFGVRPSIRLYMDKALTDFQLWNEGNSESHWNDLVRSSVQQSVVVQAQPLRDISRKEQIDSERRIVQAICEQFPCRKLRVEAWVNRTGKSQAAFYRRYRDLRTEGLVAI
jgi:hypothetical protein